MRGGSNGGGKTPEDKEFQLQQLLSETLVAGGVTDIFAVAGWSKPDISVLSEEFLAQVAQMPQKNLAVELLERLLKDELQTRFRTNTVQHKRFSEMLQESLSKYSSRSVEAAHVIKILVDLAREFREHEEKVRAMGLSQVEINFYDALSSNKSAKELMGDEVLMKMAHELAEKLKRNLTIDWQYKENVRARLRTMIKALLKRYKYLPDQEKAAIDLVLIQAETLSEDLVEAA